MSKRTYWYSANECSHRYAVESIWDCENEVEHTCIAGDAADDYHSEHDGWEASWPIVFELFDAEDAATPFARCEVDREYEPAFFATRLQGKEQEAGDAK